MTVIELGNMKNNCFYTYSAIGVNATYTEVAKYIKQRFGMEIPSREEIIRDGISSLPLGSKPKLIQNKIASKYGLNLKTSSIRKTMTRLKRNGKFPSVFTSPAVKKSFTTKFDTVVKCLKDIGVEKKTSDIKEHLKSFYGIRVGKTTINSAKQVLRSR